MYTMQGMSNGAEQTCPVKGGGCILEVSFERGFTVYAIIIIIIIHLVKTRLT
jgi:hypothetical protein